MRIEDFDFELPREQIAQQPLPERDASRLLAVDRTTGSLSHRLFSELPSLLRPGDLLVLNDAKVIPARLLGRKVGTGGKVELLLVRPAVGLASEMLGGAFQPGSSGPLEWICLGQASKGLRPSTRVELEEGLEAEVMEALGEGEYRVRLQGGSETSLAALLERAGRLPLPPYIERDPTPEDRERYQTVYARSLGSVAAPTAGLHFTPRLFAALASRGVEQVTLTLEVGPGTFLPVREGELERHRMHPERYFIPPAAAQAIRRARAEGRRVVAVGTTVVRTLESAWEEGEVRPGPGETRLFIKPGHRFRAFEVLLTNFHLPRSTLLVLVSAFLGLARTRAAYREAVLNGYRFFSYGDAMLIGDL